MPFIQLIFIEFLFCSQHVVILYIFFEICLVRLEMCIFSTSVNVFTVSLTMVFSSESLLTYLIFNSLFQLLWALANINILVATVLVSIFLHAYPIRLEGFSSILLPRYKQDTESTFSPPKKMLQCSQVVGDKLMKMGFCLLLPCPELSLEAWIGSTIRANSNVVF